MKKSVNSRRQFLKSAAAVSTAFAVPTIIPAEALGLSDATVRTHVFRARNTLRTAMEPFKEEQ